MHKTIIPFIFLLLLSFTFLESSCTTDKLPEPEPPALCDTLKVSYNLQVKEIIDNNCSTIGCHRGGAVPGNYTSYDNMQPFLTDRDFKRSVVDLRNDPELGMPPNWDTNFGPKDLTQEEFDIIVCWIENGYPED